MPAARSVLLSLSPLPEGNTASSHLLAITTGTGSSTVQVFGEIDVQQTVDLDILLSLDEEDEFNISGCR